LYYLCVVVLNQQHLKKMNNLSIYLTFIVITFFSVYGAFTMDIPTDNQIGMLFFGSMSFSVLIMVFVYDVRQYIKERKLKPQKF
jgi:hypothetical protein